MSEMLFPTCLAIHAVSVAAALALADRPAACRRVAFFGAACGSALIGALAILVLATGEEHTGVLLADASRSFVLGYRIDPLSAWFLLTFSFLAAPVAVYSVGYLAHGIPVGRSAFVGIAFNLLLMAVECVFAADGVVGFLFAWELMSLTTAALVATEHENRSSRSSAYLYLVLSHVGTGCLVTGFLLLASSAGSLAFRDILGGASTSGTLRHLEFALFLGGFGVKAGIVPLHVWLPEAHPAAPSSISALMSGGLVCAGFYGLVRVCACGLGTPDPRWGMLVLVLGGVSAILGVLYALSENDIKRMLAFSTIENSGIVLLGIGTGMIGLAAVRPELAALGLVAALYHVLNHAAFKGLLFLGAGGVVMATHTRELNDMGGLIGKMPRTAALFLVGSASIAALPLLCGFVSEWLVFQALLVGFESAERLTRIVFPLGGALLALTSALAATCFVKAFGLTFLALPRSSAAAAAQESPAIMLWPQAFLASACVVLGVCPGSIVGVLASVVAGLPGARLDPALAHGLIGLTVPRFDHVAPLLLAPALLGALGLAGVLAVRGRVARREPTWGCGLALSAATEYTAAAFSKPVVMIFRGIYRPTREVSTVEVTPYFAQEVRYRSEIAAPFERLLYVPLTRGVLAVALRLRVIQAGSLHAYLAYVLVLGVIVLWWLGGTP